MSSEGVILGEGGGRRLEVADTIIHLPGGRTHAIRDRPEIPVELLHLRVDDHGLVVPQVTDGPDDGLPRRVRLALLGRTCGMCGYPLGYWLAWHLSAPDEAHARRQRGLTGAAMHPDVCSPYAAGAYAVPPDTVWWRFVARTYKVRETDAGQTYARVPPPVRLERITPPIDRSPK